MTISLYVEWVLLLLLFCLTAITNDSLASLFAVAIFEVVCSFVCCFPTGMRNFHEQQQQKHQQDFVAIESIFVGASGWYTW